MYISYFFLQGPATHYPQDQWIVGTMLGSFSFLIIPPCGLSFLKLEEVSVDYEGTHQCPLSQLRLACHLPQCKMGLVVYYFTDSCE